MEVTIKAKDKRIVNIKTILIVDDEYLFGSNYYLCVYLR